MRSDKKIEGAGWLPLLAGFAVLFAILQGSAAVLQSLRGEAGLIVAALTLAAAIVGQRIMFAPTWRSAFQSLGLGRPRVRGVVVATALSGLLLCVFPAYLAWKGGFISVLPNAVWLALGIFAQAGIAEELVFRGYLYGNIRRGRSFWSAAILSALPFTAAHLYLFWTMDLPVALSALILSVLIGFPLAWMYELGGRTIWAPALAHAVVQGAVKLLVVHDNIFLIVWMLASAVLLWLVFFFKPSAYTRS